MPKVAENKGTEVVPAREDKEKRTGAHSTVIADSGKLEVPPIAENQSVEEEVTE